MSTTSGKRLLFLGALAACICAALTDSTFEDEAMAMPFSTAATVRTQLLNYVNQRQVATPPNVFCSNCLISAWQRRNKNQKLLTFPRSQLASAVRNYPQPVQDKIKALAYATSNTFENFNVQIQNSYALKTAFIGAARRVGETIDVAILDVDMAATLVPKYVTLSRRVCKKIVFWKKCSTQHYTERRGYHAHEINSMVTLLESEAFKMFKELVMAMPA